MNFSRKTIVALFSVAFALVVAGPASAACSVATLSECDTAGLQALIASLLSGQTTTQTTVTTQTTTGNIPAACAGISFTRNLTLASSGADVKCLQAFLNTSVDTQISVVGAGSPGNETTYFGAKTVAAVKGFQAKYGITPVAGFVGSITRAKLNALLAAGTTTGTTYPAGCTSATGYSPTTGLSCSGTGTVTTYPAGCTSATGYSPTTGQACSGTTVTVTGTPLTVALAADTPVGGNILAGEANKTVTRFTLTAGNDADATVNTLRIKSYGTALYANLNNVKIYSNGLQIGNTYDTMSAGTALFTFVPGITITKGTSRNFDVVVTIPVGATTAATVRLGLESASSIGGTVFTGTFPVVGNAYTIVYGGNIGTVTATKTGTVPSTSVGAGTENVVLGNFRIAANSTEGISVSQLVVSYDGNIGTPVYDSDVTNIRATVGGVVQGTASGFTSRKATINFATPIAIAKGGSVTVQILGDVSSGVGRNIAIFAASGAVSAIGSTSGVGIANTAPSDNNSTIGITAGRLTVSVSTASPSGSSAAYVKSSSLQTLGVFNLKAAGEDVLLSKIYLTVGETATVTPTGTVSSIGIYNEAGSLVSTQTSYDLDNAEWGTTPTVLDFDIGETLTANTTQAFYVKAITSGITLPATANIAVKLSINHSAAGNNGYSVVGTGLTSSGQEGQSSDNVKSNTALTLPTVTVYAAASANLANNTSVTPENQAVLTGAAQVLVGSFKVTAQRENQTLDGLILTGTSSSGDIKDLFSGVALYEGDTQLTDFVTPTTTNTVVFHSNDILDTVTFVKSTAKTLRIVANTLSTGNGDTIVWSVATSSMAVTGDDSGESATAPSAYTTLTFNDGVYNHGTFVLSNVVVTVAKDVGSPSGTVSRGTLNTYAIWDLQSYGTSNDVTIGTTTLTSKTGLPLGLTSTTTNLAMFRLVDENGSAMAMTATSIDAAHGTVTFIPTANNVITNGEVKKIVLLITATNDTIWPDNQGMLWTVGSMNGIEFDTGLAGSGDGTTFSIPADTNSVNIGY